MVRDVIKAIKKRLKKKRKAKIYKKGSSYMYAMPTKYKDYDLNTGRPSINITRVESNVMQSLPKLSFEKKSRKKLSTKDRSEKWFL